MWNYSNSKISYVFLPNNNFDHLAINSPITCTCSLSDQIDANSFHSGEIYNYAAVADCIANNIVHHRIPCPPDGLVHRAGLP